MTPKKRTKKHERVGTILRLNVGAIVGNWLARAKQSRELNHFKLTDEERTGRPPKLVEDLIVRLRKSEAVAQNRDAVSSTTAIAHGKVRRQQGYTDGMLVHESRILQVMLFETLQNNVGLLDLSLLLADTATTAHEVDVRLALSMDSFTNAMRQAQAV